MVTAKEVGGDFYDFYMLNDKTVAFIVADVSGKGIPAAMFMMRAKTIIKDLAESGLNVDEIFTRANEKLCENNEAGMFVTAWMGILDLKTGLLQFANAGHNPPLICAGNNKFEYMRTRSGLFLAGMEGIKYKKNEMYLMPGDQILLYTDGVTEANDIDNNLYGEDKLLNLLNSNSNVSSKELCNIVKSSVDRFVGANEQFDDITMLSLKVNCITGEDRVLVCPDKNSIKTINEFADKLTYRVEAIPKVANKINIIIDEIFSNIVNYSKANLAEISYSIENNNLYITFVDNGIPYNPLLEKEPDITLGAEERQLGGLGIFMVRKMVENIEYKYDENKNILCITMNLI